VIGSARRLGAAALAICTVGLGACGGEQGDDSARYLPGNPRIGAGALSGAAQADCRQWNDASYRQRQQVVEQLGRISNRGNYPGQRGAKLPDDKAYDVLEGACKRDYAAHFRLSKLYSRALAFSDR